MNYTPPPHHGLSLIHLDEYLLAVDKPAELLSVPGKGDDKQDCLASRVQAEYPGAMVVHRLDLPTSGLMIMARNPDVHSQLGKMFENRQIDKTYITVVNGKLTQAEGKIDFPLITDWPNRPKQKVDYETGKPALTRYRLIKYDDETDTSRIELKPETGRTHQLRVHMAEIGHAIVGDRFYASEEVRAKSSRLLLHATMLEFIHPITEQAITLQSLPPF